MSKAKGVDEARSEGRKVIDDLERADDRVCGGDGRVSVAWRLFQKDPAPWRALEALGLSFHAHLSAGQTDFDPEEPMEVPGWVVFELLKAFKSWQEANGAEPFGVCLGLESRDRRTPSSYQKWREEERDRYIAICVAEVLTVERKVELAVPAVAKRLGLGERTVWDAWGQHEEAARLVSGRLQQTP